MFVADRESLVQDDESAEQRRPCEPAAVYRGRPSCFLLYCTVTLLNIIEGINRWYQPIPLCFSTIFVHLSCGLSAHPAFFYNVHSTWWILQRALIDLPYDTNLFLFAFPLMWSFTLPCFLFYYIPRWILCRSWIQSRWLAFPIFNSEQRKRPASNKGLQRYIISWKNNSGWLQIDFLLDITIIRYHYFSTLMWYFNFSHGLSIFDGRTFICANDLHLLQVRNIKNNTFGLTCLQPQHFVSLWNYYVMLFFFSTGFHFTPQELTDKRKKHSLLPSTNDKVGYDEANTHCERIHFGKNGG